MLDNEFYPKPVYSVYNMLAGLFREAQFRRQLEIGNGSWAFEFAVPGGILIPAWNESGATRTLPVTAPPIRLSSSTRWGTGARSRHGRHGSL